MKKKLALILIMSLIFSAIFTSCSKEKTPAEESGSSSSSVASSEKSTEGTEKPRDTSEEQQTTAPVTTEPVDTQPQEEWVLCQDYDFFDKDGNAAPPVDGGDPWSLFPYWLGWDDTQIYDSHGVGHYVTATITCSKFKVGFGNGGPNGQTNVEIYVDGELKLNMNLTEEFDGMPNYSAEIEVTPGEHTIMVKAGEPLTPETWNGMTFNVIAYVPVS